MSNVPFTNTGHGHVWERLDGIKARCGGVMLCMECQADQRALNNEEINTLPHNQSSKDGFLTYTVTFRVPKDILCDEETLKQDYNNSWQDWLDWFYKNETIEVLTGIGTDPIEIKVALKQLGGDE